MQVLRRVHFDQAYSDLALSSELAKSGLATVDRGLVTEMVYGVLRHRSYLDWLIGRVSSVPVARMDQRVLDALRLGAYQLLYLDRVPAHAAVNESVGLAPRRASGLVNAVLRRLGDERRAPGKPRLDDPIEQAALVHSHPRWLLDEWRDLFGDETAIALAEANQRVPAAVLRVNPVRATRDDVLAHLAGLDAEPTRYSPWGVRVPRLEPVLQSPVFAAGELFAQSEASQLVSELVGAAPGERVLDVCAAPGGKATHLAALTLPGGQVVACDVRPNRLRLIIANLKRLGLDNVVVKLRDGFAPWAPEEVGDGFDRVLVDAPCTALGTLAKHPEIKWHVSPNDPARLAETQIALLGNAAAAVRRDGTLLYSVCTLTRAETHGVVAEFLRVHPEFRLDDLRRDFAPRYDDFLQEDGTFLSLPSRTGSEGMFAARFVREDQ